MTGDHADLARVELQELGHRVVRLRQHLVLADRFAGKDGIPAQSIGLRRIRDDAEAEDREGSADVFLAQLRQCTREVGPALQVVRRFIRDHMPFFIRERAEIVFRDQAVERHAVGAVEIVGGLLCLAEIEHFAQRPAPEFVCDMGPVPFNSVLLARLG